MKELRQKIYVVTSGLYDDYGIEGLYATEDLAQARVERLVGERRGPKDWRGYPAEEWFRIQAWVLNEDDRFGEDIGLRIQLPVRS